MLKECTAGDKRHMHNIFVSKNSKLCGRRLLDVGRYLTIRHRSKDIALASSQAPAGPFL